MKKLIFSFSLLVILVGCNNGYSYDGKVFSDYNQYQNYSLNKLKSPVVLVSSKKRNSDFENSDYNIIVKDAESNIVYYDYSKLSTLIATTYSVGDTIR